MTPRGFWVSALKEQNSLVWAHLEVDGYRLEGQTRNHMGAQAQASGPEFFLPHLLGTQLSHRWRVGEGLLQGV